MTLTYPVERLVADVEAKAHRGSKVGCVEDPGATARGSSTSYAMEEGVWYCK
jgi:hypothetical protein